MEKSVLIFSAHPAFAELSRLSLAENKTYHVTTALTIEEMQMLINQTEFDLVILDADYHDENLLNLVATIQEQYSQIKFLVFPPDNQAGHPDLKKIRVDTLSLKPFYLPDFLKSVDEVINMELVKSEEAEKHLPISEIDHRSEEYRWHSIPDWFDPAKIGDQLDLALNGIKAQGAFVLSFDGSAVYRGELKDSAVSEISTYLLNKVDLENKSDLVRFMRLAADDLDHLIYAISFRENHLLVLIFEKTLPLSMARSYISLVEGNLNEMIGGQPPGREQPSKEKSSTFGQGTKADGLLSMSMNIGEVSSEEVEMLKISQLIDQVTGKKQRESTEESGDSERQQLSEQSGITHELPDWLTEPEETLSEISEPVSDIDIDETLHWVKEEEQQDTNLKKYEDSNSSEELLNGLVFPWDQKSEMPEAQEIEETMEARVNVDEQITDLKIQPVEEKLEIYGESVEILDHTDDSTVDLIGNEADLPVLTEEQIDFQREITQPTTIADVEDSLIERHQEETISRVKREELPESLIEFNAVKAGFSCLNYTCVLVPRFPQHFLVGDLAKRLSEWLPQLAIAFGWRLERLSVRPQYIQWTIIVDPTIAPNMLIRLVRRETSKRLFKLWPDYELENPSKDFWAPGYLILSGYCPPNREALSDFVQQTRVRQGIRS